MAYWVACSEGRAHQNLADNHAKNRHLQIHSSTCLSCRLPGTVRSTPTRKLYWRLGRLASSVPRPTIALCHGSASTQTLKCRQITQEKIRTLRAIHLSFAPSQSSGVDVLA